MKYLNQRFLSSGEMEEFNKKINGILIKSKLDLNHEK